MKISVSNIAWGQEYDNEMYQFLKDNRVDGVEVAPTRVLGDNPYEKLAEGKEFQKMLSEQYGLEISSMQSIWYGKGEKIFGEQREREVLIEYTKKAFELANVLDCHNLVFGCPRNRNINSQDDIKVAEEFFCKLGELAIKNNTVLALEANPPIYNTNFLNTTMEAYEMVKKISSKGIRLNFDLGTVIQNGEDISEMEQMLPEVNHVHISEPHLAEIQYGVLQSELISLLSDLKYDKYVSIEMKNLEDLARIKDSIKNLQKLTWTNE